MSEQVTQVETPKEAAWKAFQARYANLASRFGDLKYRIMCIEADAQSVAEEMKALNQEWVKRSAELDGVITEEPKKEEQPQEAQEEVKHAANEG